jgi:hypothetical protein
MLLVPKPTLDTVLHPTYAAVVGAAATMCAVVVTRARRGRGTAAERVVFAVFLLLMPMVYWSTCWLAAAGGAWLWIELAGQLIFLPFVLAGWKRAPVWLAIGMATHGLGWDLWHLDRGAVMPRWYALDCLIIDLSWAVYILAQARHWRRAQASGIEAARA